MRRLTLSSAIPEHPGFLSTTVTTTQPGASVADEISLGRAAGVLEDALPEEAVDAHCLPRFQELLRARRPAPAKVLLRSPRKVPPRAPVQRQQVAELESLTEVRILEPFQTARPRSRRLRLSARRCEPGPQQAGPRFDRTWRQGRIECMTECPCLAKGPCRSRAYPYS